MIKNIITTIKSLIRKCSTIGYSQRTLKNGKKAKAKSNSYEKRKRGCGLIPETPPKY
jgi:hypothetical protein